jgi:hypothetical protein
MMLNKGSLVGLLERAMVEFSERVARVATNRPDRGPIMGLRPFCFPAKLEPGVLGK